MRSDPIRALVLVCSLGFAACDMDSSSDTTAQPGTAGTSGGGNMTGGTDAGGSSAGGAGSGGASAGGQAGALSAGTGGEDWSMALFLLIGQSNMEGMPPPEPQDLQEDPRIQVLAYDDCPNLGRTYHEWYPASPPLHSCWSGLGPGDYFAKEMAAALAADTIGLVPCGISGVDIDFFRKDVVSARRDEFRIPPDDHWAGAYEWVIERALLAQQSGTIRGIIFHQGESDTGNAAWVGKVTEMVSDLRTDLGLGEVPFIAGELLHGGCCDAHNPLVNQLATEIPNCAVVSAADLTGIDTAHFDLAGQRELGLRYAAEMQALLSLP